MLRIEPGTNICTADATDPCVETIAIASRQPPIHAMVPLVVRKVIHASGAETRAQNATIHKAQRGSRRLSFWASPPTIANPLAPTIPITSAMIMPIWAEGSL